MPPTTGPDAADYEQDAPRVQIPGNRCTLLVDGDAIFDALELALSEARHTIQLEVFQFGGDVGMRLMDAILARHAAGVEVRVLLDPAHGGVGSIRLQTERVVAALDAAGIPRRDFNLGHMAKGPTQLSNVGLINHAKLVVIDHQMAFTGGMNFYDDGERNHDYMVRIEGPAAAGLAEVMDRDWLLSGPGSGWVARAALVCGDATIEIAETGPQLRTIRALLIDRFAAARERLWVEVLFLDDDHLIDALIAAKTRGVDVRAILDPLNWGQHVPELDRLPFHGIPNWHAVDRLLGAEIPVSWFKPARPGQNLHAKITLIDDRHLLIGSANYTYRALDRSREVTIAVECPEVALAFARAFEKDEAASERIRSLTAFQKLLGTAFAVAKHRVYAEDRSIHGAAWRFALGSSQD